MSSIEYNDQRLSPVNYKELLEAIQAELQKQAKTGKHIFLEKDKVIFDIDVIANAVAEKFTNSNHYPFEIRDGLSHASVHALDINEKSDFSHDLQRTILAELHTQITQRLDTKHHSLGQYVSTLLKPMDTFDQNRPAGLSYPINKEYSLEKRSLHANESLSKDDTWLKAHKLTLSVTNIDSFNQQIIESINDYIEKHDDCEDEDIEDVRENLISAQNQEKSNRKDS